MALLSHYKVITVTHHNLNVNDIGHFFLQNVGQENHRSQQLKDLKETFGFDECMYLETCNRVTYVLYTDHLMDNNFLRKFFVKINPKLEEKTIKDIHNFVSLYEGQSAVQHLFELSASMDSLVVGEREIFRQLREAYKWCNEDGYTGDKLRLLQKATVENAKKIYHETKIGEKALSIVSLAMNALLQSNVKRDSKILLVGAGETNTLVAKFLKKYDFSNIRIYNRSLHNAEELSKELSATSFHIQDLKTVKGDFDIIFICTSANKVIIDLDFYRQMLFSDTSEKTIIDLAIPRNVSKEVVEQNNVKHIDIESLKKLSEANLEFRKQEVERARPIITKNINKFNNLFHERQIELALTHIPSEIAAVKDRAINKVYKSRLESLDSESKELVMEMLDYMEKKCISVPMKLAKKNSIS